MGVYNLQSVLSELQKSPPNVRKQAADMMYRYGRDDQNVPQPTLPQPIDAPSGGVALNNGLGIADILAQIQGDGPLDGGQPGQGLENPVGGVRGGAGPDGLPRPVMTDVDTRRPPLDPYQGKPGRYAMDEKYGGSLDSRASAAQDAYLAAVAEPVKKSKWWKNLGIIGAEIASNVFNPGNQVPIRSWGGLKKDSHVRSALEHLRPLLDLQKVEQDRDYRKAQTKNIYDDNTRQEQERKDKISKAQETETTRRRSNFRKGHPFFNPKTATAADVNELASFGETPESMGTYNFSKPEVHEVAGVTYKFNPNTQSYEDSGIPHDGSKALTEYTVKDADGVTYKYTTTNEKAAGLKTQLVAAGLQIQAANARQASQHEFELNKQQIGASLQKELQDHAALIAAGKIQEAEESKKRILDYQKQLIESMKTKK